MFVCMSTTISMYSFTCTSTFLLFATTFTFTQHPSYSKFTWAHLVGVHNSHACLFPLFIYYCKTHFCSFSNLVSYFIACKNRPSSYSTRTLSYLFTCSFWYSCKHSVSIHHHVEIGFHICFRIYAIHV